MLKRLPFKRAAFPYLVQFSLKLILGVFLFGFFLSYEPSLNFPPQKPLVLAQEPITLSQQVQAAVSEITFHLPHPGYLSTHFSSYHPGVDLAGGLGLPVKPIAQGTITSVGFNFWGLGLVVEMSHPSGYKSLYAHLGKTYVSQGQVIDENTAIGEVGLTGNTSGPHTHIEITKDNQKIDPLAVLPTMRDYPLAQDFSPVGGQTQIYPQPKYIPLTQIASEPKKELKEEVKPPLPQFLPNPTTPPPTILQQSVQKISSPLGF